MVLSEPEVPITNYTVRRAVEQLRGYYIDVEIERVRPKEGKPGVYVVTGRYRKTGIFGIMTLERGRFSLEFDVSMGKPRLTNADIEVEEEGNVVG